MSCCYRRLRSVRFSSVRSVCFPDEQTKHQRGWELPRGPQQEEAEPGLSSASGAPALNPRLCLSGSRPRSVLEGIAGSALGMPKKRVVTRVTQAHRLTSGCGFLVSGPSQAPHHV